MATALLDRLPDTDHNGQDLGPENQPQQWGKGRIHEWAKVHPEAADASRIASGKATRARFDLVAECRKLAPAALKALQAALTDSNKALRVTAASILLDRGFGKAAQLVEYAGEVEFRLASLDDATLDGLIRERIKGLGLSRQHSAPALPPPAPEPDIMPIIAPSEA